MIKKTNLLIIIVGFLLSACFEKAIAPVITFNGEANMTIADFQKLHTLNTSNPVTLIDTNIIITGVVTSTDQFGSNYRELFFQDETGGISIRIANTSYYTKYRVGQRIFVKAEGLYLGNYVSSSPTNPGIGFYQLALFGNGSTINIPANMENRHIFRSDIPGTLPAPKIITSRSDIVMSRDLHTWVKLTNCYFTEANGTTKYFEIPPNSTLNTISRPIEFNIGSGKVEARISAFNSFANETLPQGALNVTGILTMFLRPFFTPTPDTTYQLIINRIEDVEIFPPARILRNFDMTTDPFSQEQGWTNRQITGTKVWTYISQGSNSRVYIQPLAGEETECWFVSPKFNFAGEKNIHISLKYRLTERAGENLQIYYTINGGANWTSLGFTPQLGGIIETIIDLDENIATNPNLQIAFKYKTTQVFPMCAIMGVTFKANVF